MIHTLLFSQNDYILNIVRYGRQTIRLLNRWFKMISCIIRVGQKYCSSTDQCKISFHHQLRPKSSILSMPVVSTQIKFGVTMRRLKEEIDRYGQIDGEGNTFLLTVYSREKLQASPAQACINQNGSVWPNNRTHLLL